MRLGERREGGGWKREENEAHFYGVVGVFLVVYIHSWCFQLV